MKVPVTAGALAAGVLLVAVARAADPTFTPTPGSPIPVGTNPHSIASGDFDGNATIDLATANEASNNVSILLGNGAGGFAAGTSVGVGTAPLSVAAADFNLDAKIDLAVANAGSDSISILLGDGSGGFANAPGSPVAAGDQPWYVVASDLNGDGRPDLAASRFTNTTANGEVVILLGNGAGGFGSPSFVGAGRVPYGIAAADLNGDGARDLAVANQFSNTVSILLGNGSGGFAAGTPVSSGSGPSWVAAGGLNGDAAVDLVVTNQGSGTVSILLGNGSGGFSPAAGSPVAAGNGPTPLALTDLNGDAKLDLAVGNINSDNVSVLVGLGTGGFAAASGSPVPAGDGPFSLAAPDVNGDGRPDLAVANYHASNVAILLNATPTAVGVGRLTARLTPAGVELRWRTAHEVGLLGFDVYRGRVKLNRALIPARGFAAGAAYRYVVAGRRAGVYRLRALQADGTRAWVATTVVHL